MTTNKYRHFKRGTEYTLIGEATLQTEKPLSDDAEVIVYRGDDGKIWVRSKQEFFDGRFEEVQPTSAKNAQVEASLKEEG